MKAYLLVDETAEGDHPVGVYSTPQKALAAMRTMQDSHEAVVREYEVDDALTYNYVRIYDPALNPKPAPRAHLPKLNLIVSQVLRESNLSVHYCGNRRRHYTLAALNPNGNV